MKINKRDLKEKYFIKHLSAARIGKIFNCSTNKINYWLAKYELKKRTISEAIYQIHNPLGDPFTFHQPTDIEKGILFGLGLGLYWGEGTKRGKGGIRLGNTDSRLIKKFIKFLEKVFDVKKNKLKFGLQIFNDISPDKALAYWLQELKVEKGQFYKIIVSKVRGKGTYKYKSEYGVLTVYFHNTKLKKLICQLIDNVQELY